MLFKGVLIGLELREFDRMCAMPLVFPTLTKSRFGKNQIYEVLTPNRGYTGMQSTALPYITTCSFYRRL